MKVTRRDFLKMCGISAAGLGLSQFDLLSLQEALANPPAPSVIWLQGSSCTGCSISFLNRFTTWTPHTAANILTDSINLIYHPNLMAMAGQSAVDLAKQAYTKGGYILAVEGGVPTAFGGRACWAWTYNNVDVTFQQVVKDFAARASAIIAVGTCASFGGVPAAGPNPTAVQSVKAVTGKSTINIAGCPPHPNWIFYPVAQLLLKKSFPVDSNGRPTYLYGQTVHSQCPRNHSPGSCLASKGCRGPGTHADCPTKMWNNYTNWCVNANAPCYACTEPTFPGTSSLYAVKYNPHGGTDLNCARCHD